MQLPIPVDPRLLDPRLYLRAMDDLHTLTGVAVSALDDLHRIAEVIDRIEDIEARMNSRIAGVEIVVQEGIEAIRSLGGVEDRAVELLRAAEEISASLPLL